MKRILYLIFWILFFTEVYSADPEYFLKAGNALQTGPNSLEFDILIVHTNSSVSTFEYAGGQYFFDFNLNINNGGALIYSIVNSDLPPDLQPRNPVVFTTGGEMQLRLSVNNIPSPGQGFLISNVLPGTKIARMRLMTNAETFSIQYFNLRWRNGPGNPYTRIYSFVNSAFTEITQPAFHSIDSINHPLPVELTSFVSEVNGNNIVLKWSTSVEINNSGFEIERKFSQDILYKYLGFIKGAGSSNELNNYFFNDKITEPGKYEYRLRQIDFNGNFRYYDLGHIVVIENPVKFVLEQNFPNPFNPETVIKYNLQTNGRVILNLYDAIGKFVMQLVNENQNAGYYSIKFNAGNLAGGVYFYRLEAGGYSKTRQMILLK